MALGKNSKILQIVASEDVVYLAEEISRRLRISVSKVGVLAIFEMAKDMGVGLPPPAPDPNQTELLPTPEGGAKK